MSREAVARKSSVGGVEGWGVVVVVTEGWGVAVVVTEGFLS